ncbi:MAG TPA: rRNA maturation RNase YbeY [Casimicrobiaceae bacterium]|nr:rRNA maturation RNase YbeY [Casimicrobiaceae bacterium]
MSRAPRVSVALQFEVARTRLPSPVTLRRWVMLAAERDVRVTLRFVGDRESRRLNARFRGKDYATNVLTFVYDDPVHDAPHGAPLAGDIVICVPVVRREARAASRPLRAHCAHLVIHGMLHLQGHGHDRDANAARMEAREIELLAKLRYANPYAP